MSYAKNTLLQTFYNSRSSFPGNSFSEMNRKSSGKTYVLNLSPISTSGNGPHFGWRVQLWRTTIPARSWLPVSVSFPFLLSLSLSLYKSLNWRLPPLLVFPSNHLLDIFILLSLNNSMAVHSLYIATRQHPLISPNFQLSRYKIQSSLFFCRL